MGVYTELVADVVLKDCDDTKALINWLNEDIDGELPVSMKDAEFFGCDRAHFFRVDDGPVTKSTGLYVSIRAELKNYESEIEKLWNVVKPLYVSGCFRSLYEEHILWFDHTKGAFIGVENTCPLCGCAHDSNYRCQ